MWTAVARLAPVSCRYRNKDGARIRKRSTTLFQRLCDCAPGVETRSLFEICIVVQCTNCSSTFMKETFLLEFYQIMVQVNYSLFICFLSSGILVKFRFLTSLYDHCFIVLVFDAHSLSYCSKNMSSEKFPCSSSTVRKCHSCFGGTRDWLGVSCSQLSSIITRELTEGDLKNCIHSTWIHLLHRYTANYPSAFHTKKLYWE